MKYLILFLIVCVSIIPLVYAIQTESGTFEWKFCDGVEQFTYEITNGTLHDTAHLKLSDTDNCENNSGPTDYQLQLFHTSNNHTDFTISAPDTLEFEKIDITVVGKGYAESFQLNETHKSLTFRDFIHDKNKLVTIIMDFMTIPYAFGHPDPLSMQLVENGMHNYNLKVIGLEQEEKDAEEIELFSKEWFWKNFIGLLIISIILVMSTTIFFIMREEKTVSTKPTL